MTGDIGCIEGSVDRGLAAAATFLSQHPTGRVIARVGGTTRTADAGSSASAVPRKVRDA